MDTSLPELQPERSLKVKSLSVWRPVGRDTASSDERKHSCDRN